MTMEKITKKEAFECAISQIIAINGALNRQDISIYDYALILYKGSLSPIECLKPGNTFKWKNLNKGEYGQKAYAFYQYHHIIFHSLLMSVVVLMKKLWSLKNLQLLSIHAHGLKTHYQKWF